MSLGNQESKSHFLQKHGQQGARTHSTQGPGGDLEKRQVRQHSLRTHQLPKAPAISLLAARLPENHRVAMKGDGAPPDRQTAPRLNTGQSVPHAACRAVVSL